MSETPRVRFHLPGLRFNYPLNMFWVSMLDMHPEYFREGVEIGSMFGCFPVALWNGGRLISNDQTDAKYISEVIKSINAKGIPVRYTFTNPLITEEDLDDSFCNFCMQAADNGMNEVIVVSPVLEQYIRDKYPSFKLTSSTCKEIRNAEELGAELEKDYKYVVLDYNLNNNMEVIDGLKSPEKVEVLINPVCQPACPERGEHYRWIAKQQKTILENRKLPMEQRKPVETWDCHFGEMNNLYTIMEYPTYVSPETIWGEYVPRGVNNFKIEGRTGNLFSLIETYTHFMIKPEKIGAARLLLLRNLEASNIITVNKPKPARFIAPADFKL